MDDSYGGLGYFQQLNNLYEEVEQEIDALREFEYQAASNEGSTACSRPPRRRLCA